MTASKPEASDAKDAKESKESKEPKEPKASIGIRSFLDFLSLGRWSS